MANPLENVVTVEGPGGAAQTSDAHRDPSKPPKITSVLPGLSVNFDTDSPNTGYKPIDAIIKLKIESPGGIVPPNNQVCIIQFGSVWQDANNGPLPPVVLYSDEGNNDPPIWRIRDVTADHCAIVAAVTIQIGTVTRLRLACLPSN